MPKYQYLIVGGGMAASAAVNGIRELDVNGSIGIVGAEHYRPYMRPPLTKSLWKGMSEDKVWLYTPENGVEMVKGRTVVSLDPVSKTITDDFGANYGYDKLLIATGGTPRKLQFDPPGVVYYRNLDDYHRVKDLSQSGNIFAVIGGGFIGWEMAAALAMNNKEVFMIFPEATMGARIYPTELGEFLNEYYADKGVNVIAEDVISEIGTDGSGHTITTLGGREIRVDGIVAGIGILPNVMMAEKAGLTVENGITVDNRLRTSSPDIYAAGDVAYFFNPTLGKRVRLEHVDNATQMGGCAGKAMAGGNCTYDYLPFFYSDLFDLGYEAIGDINANLEVVYDWKEKFAEGIIYYMDKDRVRGVMLWNVWDKVEEARELLGENRTYTAEELKGRIT